MIGETNKDVSDSCHLACNVSRIARRISNSFFCRSLVPLLKLMKRCWAEDATKRPSFHDILERLEEEVSNSESLSYESVVTICSWSGVRPLSLRSWLLLAVF